MDTNNIKLIDGIITAITNHIFHRIGELGLIRDIHVRLDKLEAEMHERKPEMEQSLETMLQASTWFDKMVESAVDNHTHDFLAGVDARALIDSAIEDYDFGDAIAEAINNHDFSSQIDDAIHENDLFSESAARDLIDNLFEEKIDTALSRLTVRITHNE
jgi:hypothetical protein